MEKKLILILITAINIYCSEPYIPESDSAKTYIKNGKIEKDENVLARLKSVKFKLEECVQFKIEKLIRRRQRKEDLKKYYYQRLLDNIKKLIINNEINFLDQYNKERRQTW